MSQPFPAAMVIFSLILLIILAVQYPFSVTLPIGSDAVFHTTIMQTLADYPITSWSLWKQLWYPGVYVIFAPATLLTFLDWPTRFIWWMVLGHVASGLALAWLLKRLANWSAAAASLGLWALTPIIATPFFEDGTLAQLWSLPFLFLTYERIIKGKYLAAIMVGFFTITTHPMTALVMLTSLAVSYAVSSAVRYYLLTRSQQLAHLAAGLISVVLLLVLLMFLATSNTEIFTERFEKSSYFSEIIAGSFLPWTILSVVGFLFLSQQYLKSHPLTVILLANFTLLSWLLAANHLLGLGIWTKRFAPYLVAATIILAAYALPSLLRRSLPNNFLRFTFYCVLFASLAVGLWHENSRIYRAHQSRLHELKTTYSP